MCLLYKWLTSGLALFLFIYCMKPRRYKMKSISFLSKITVSAISHCSSGRRLLFSFLPQVMPVSYVRFSASPVLSTHSRESLKALPLGVVLTFAVHFHGSTGEVLHSSNSLLTFSTNRSVAETLFGQERSRQGWSQKSNIYAGKAEKM